jgi:hypothetical protein
MNDEDPELADLRALFGEVPRESAIPVGVYVKYMTVQVRAHTRATHLLCHVLSHVAGASTEEASER